MQNEFKIRTLNYSMNGEFGKCSHLNKILSQVKLFLGDHLTVIFLKHV